MTYNIYQLAESIRKQQQIEFDNISAEELKQCMLVSRNMNADPKLISFSASIPVADKFRMMEEYMKSDIISSISAIDSMWTAVLLEQPNEMLSIDEIKEFRLSKQELVDDVQMIVKSCLLYFAKVLNISNDLNERDVNEKFIGKNVISLAKNAKIVDFLLDDANDCKVHNYVQYCKKDMMLHLEPIKKMKGFVMLYGKSTPQWQLFNDILKQAPDLDIASIFYSQISKSKI